jgi:ubiquinone/menaquinone biosynthesis C-methylase UbiE
MSKDVVRKQFGQHAAAYATSAVHAKGASLARLVELVQPQSDWRALDVATAAGHTALAFAPHVAHVIASDLTPEMLTVAEKLAAEREIANISFEIADAEDLPFDDASFDLVTCRIAPHHFARIDRFADEAHRVLRDRGVLAVVDNVAPPGEAGDYVNAFEKLRDPSHHRALALEEWVHAFASAGFERNYSETAPKRMEFQPWAERMGASDTVIAELRELLLSAPADAAAYFQPRAEHGVLFFFLTEAIVIGHKVVEPDVDTK